MPKPLSDEEIEQLPPMSGARLARQRQKAEAARVRADADRVRFKDALERVTSPYPPGTVVTIHVIAHGDRYIASARVGLREVMTQTGQTPPAAVRRLLSSEVWMHIDRAIGGSES